MSLVAIGAPFAYPDFVPTFGSAHSTFTFDALNDLTSTVFKIPASGNIDNIHFRVVSVSSPVLTLSISVQTVTAAGLASGTNYKTHTTVTLANPTTGNKSANVAITGAVAGDEVCIVIKCTAYTSGSATIIYGFGSTTTALNYPYRTANTGAGEAVAALNGIAAFSAEYASAAFHPAVQSGGAMICAGRNTATVNNSGTTRRGNIIRPPMKCRASGIWASADTDGGCTFNLRLGSDGSQVTGAVVTPVTAVRAAQTLGTFFYPFDAGATAELTAGTDYYVDIEGTDATNSTITLIDNIPAVAHLDQLSGGQNCYGVTYAGSYVAANTTRYAIGLMIDQLDDGSGGGGLRLAGHGGLVA